MSLPRLIQLDCVDGLREAAPLWDDLWWRSDVSCPTFRAEMVAQWLEQFARPGDFHALVVEDGGQWVAALPLVRTEHCRLLSTGGLTSNEWSPNGELMLDPAAASDAVLEVLVSGIRRTPWQLLWFDDVPLAAPGWSALQGALDHLPTAGDRHWQMEVGLIELAGDWETFRRRLTKKHRCKMARCNRRLAERGEVRVELLGDVDPAEIETRLQTAFEIEDRSWKGTGGTSVLSSPGMFEFFVRQARQLARWGQLELAFLHCGDVPVASIYGYGAKGVSYWHKIGYDPAYQCCTPGQLLQCYVLERFHSEPGRRAVDTMGRLTGALAKWNPTPYRVGRLMIAPRALVGRMAMYACKRLTRYRHRAGDAQAGGDAAQSSDAKAPSPQREPQPA